MSDSLIAAAKCNNVNLRILCSSNRGALSGHTEEYYPVSLLPQRLVAGTTGAPTVTLAFVNVDHPAGHAAASKNHYVPVAVTPTHALAEDVRFSPQGAPHCATDLTALPPSSPSSQSRSPTAPDAASVPSECVLSPPPPGTQQQLLAQSHNHQARTLCLRPLGHHRMVRKRRLHNVLGRYVIRRPLQ